MDVLEREEIENEIELSEDEYIPASQRVYAASEDVKDTIKAVLEVHEEAKLQRLPDGTVNKKAYHIFKNANDKSLACIQTKLYQVVEQDAAKAVHHRGGTIKLRTRLEIWPRSRTSRIV